jgi:ribose/xylose/arabinose/galactoside ABC-type transport system permease subunit
MTAVTTPSAPTEAVAPVADEPRRSLAGSLRGAGLPIAGIVVLVVFFSIFADGFVQTSTIWTVLRESAVLLTVAVGLTFVVMIGSIDLSVGAIVSFSGLVAATVAKDGNWLLAVVAGLAVGLVTGAVNGGLFAYLKVPSFLVTLGIGLVVGGIAVGVVGGRAVQVLFNYNFLTLGQGTLLGSFPLIAVWALVLWGVLSWVNARTRFGRYTYAVGGAEAVSSLAGIPVRRVKFYALLISGTLAGLAGVLLASRIGAATPDMGDKTTLDAIAAVVMGGTALTGGIGGVHRTLLGVLVITILGTGLSTMGTAPYLQEIIQGAVVIIAVALTLDRSKLSILK